MARMTTMQAMRAWTGPAVLSYGFRPFFFLAALWAIIAMGIWIALIFGYASFSTLIDPASWHAHEFIFGYATAVIAGFLLTAVPNWTGRLPIVGRPLLGLVLVWVMGRVVFLIPSKFPYVLAAFLDASFGCLLIFYLAREIVVGRNWRNLPVLALLLLITLANSLFHWQVALQVSSSENMGLRLAIAAEVMLISLIGGRIVPSFTRNWLVQQGIKTLPASMGRLDFISLLLSAAALILFVCVPSHGATGFFSILAGFYHFVRLSRWQSLSTLSEPLLWVLHLGYFAIALGFIAVGVSAFGVLPLAGSLHVWLVGGVGLMSLAVMTRAIRGHTNRPLSASRLTTTLYVLVVVSFATRYGAVLFPSYSVFGWMSAGGAWIAAFILFLFEYSPMLFLPRLGKI